MTPAHAVVGAATWTSVSSSRLGRGATWSLVSDNRLPVDGRDPATWDADEVAERLAGATILLCDGEHVGYAVVEQLETSHVRLVLELVAACGASRWVEALSHLEEAVRYRQAVRKLSIRVRTCDTPAMDGCRLAGWTPEGELRGVGVLDGRPYDLAQFSAPTHEEDRRAVVS